MKSRIAAGIVAFVMCLAVGVDSAQAIVKTWRKVLSDQTLSVTVMPSPTPGEPSIILAGTKTTTVGSISGIRRSTDGGATWATVFGSSAFSLAADPLTPGRVYAATSSGLFASSDYGQTWARLNAGIMSSVAVSPFNPLVIFGGNLKSVDGGATWYPMVGLPPFASSTATDAMAHLKCSRDPARPGFMLAAFGEKAYRSDNGGESWVKFMDYVDSVEIDPVDASIFYTGGRCGQPLTRHYPGGSFRTYGIDHIHAIAIDPVSHGTLFVAADYATFTSIDFGKTVQGGTSFGEVPEGRMVYDASNGQVLLPTRGGLMIKNSWCLDGDRDGYSPAGGLCGVVDCADDDFKRNPSIRENCLDAVDNDCDGAIDLADTLCIDLCSDKDKDGFLAFGCPGGGDCWDTQPAVFPGATEVCDGMDNNCDGRYDEGFDEDNDWSTTCSGDCNDHDANVFPWAAEFPFDTIDQNCDGYDLTIKYHRVKYQQTHDYLLVEVGSAYGADAALELSYFGPLAWDANRNLWVGEFADIQAKPSFITTCGVEGCRDFNINLSKIKVQHEHEILRVEVESAYGEFDNVTVDSYPLAWDPIKKLWIGELLGNSVMPAYLTICTADGCMMYYPE